MEDITAIGMATQRKVVCHQWCVILKFSTHSVSKQHIMNKIVLYFCIVKQHTLNSTLSCVNLTQYNMFIEI